MDILEKIENVLNEGKDPILIVKAKDLTQLKEGDKIKILKHAGIYVDGKITDIGKKSVGYESDNSNISGRTAINRIEFS